MQGSTNSQNNEFEKVLSGKRAASEKPKKSIKNRWKYDEGGVCEWCNKVLWLNNSQQKII